MQITIIFLDYLRHDYTLKVKDNNFNNAGYPFEIINIDRKGVSAAINDGLIQVLEGAVVTMANDILMPDNWLVDMVRHADRVPMTGIVGIHTVETLPPPVEVNGVTIHEGAPFGNVLLTRNCLDKVGYYNTDLDPYSTNDYDYVYRAQMAGLRTYYIPGEARHIGHDVGDGTPYRAMKDAGLQNDKGKQWIEYYQKTGNFYLPFEQTLPCEY